MKKKIVYEKIVVILCVIVLLTSNVYINSSAEVPLREKFKNNPLYEGKVDYYSSNKYRYFSSILEEYEKYHFEIPDDYAVIIEAENIAIDDRSNIVTNASLYEKDTPVFVWDDNTPAAEFAFDVQSEGIYEVEVEYCIPENSSSSAIRALYIDGEMPFFEAGSIVFDQLWRDAGEPIINSLGDEVRPKQVQVKAWINWKLSDSKGIYSQPFKFYFKPGRHVIKLEYVDKPMIISRMTVKPAEKIPSYKEVREMYEAKGYKKATQTVEFQAENTVLYKNDPTLSRECNSDPASKPVSYINRKFNVIGAWKWRRGQQSITWQFTVNETGLYKIGMRCAQVWNDGIPSYRQIAVDGKVPFKELEHYTFKYDREWYTETLKDASGEPYLFYLEEGDHTLTMAVKYGETSQIIQSLYEDSILLSDMIRDIIKITGNDPDPNYDYELMKTIPTLHDDMTALSESMQYKYDLLMSLSNRRPAMANNFLTIKNQLQRMLKDPFSIAGKLEQLNNALTSLTAWYQDIQNQPLVVDYFLVGSPDDKWKNDRSGLFSKIKASIGNFLISFKKDYDNIGSILDESTEIKAKIDVWVSRGTEWVELIKEMADEDFTPKTGIYVNMNVMPASQLNAGAVNALMLAISSGKAPDVAMGVDSQSPVEFAIRDAVHDLSKFENFETVAERFIPSIFIPYKYLEGTYAIPETMNFTVMFYRKDILQELNMKLPDTRQELYNYVLPVLYQNSMQFYYPNNDYSPFLFQHGADYYTPDMMRSGLDTPEAYRAFKEFAELFTNYGVPVTANFFNRMRTGEMPIGIGNYSTYITLAVSAPELAGRWGVALIPGLEKSDGTIDRSFGGIAAQCDIILNQSQKKEEAWEFLDWWTSTPVQTMYAKQIESMIGVEARWNSANYEAFTNLSWNKDDLEVIKEQLKWAREVPVVLGGYFTSRHINNAWNRVIIDKEPVRDSLEKAVEDINRELRMKQEEYGIIE